MNYEEVVLHVRKTKDGKKLTDYNLQVLDLLLDQRVVSELNSLSNQLSSNNPIIWIISGIKLRILGQMKKDAFQYMARWDMVESIANLAEEIKKTKDKLT